jgi:hypothetical protein
VTTISSSSAGGRGPVASAALAGADANHALAVKSTHAAAQHLPATANEYD